MLGENIPEVRTASEPTRLMRLKLTPDHRLSFNDHLYASSQRLRQARAYRSTSQSLMEAYISRKRRKMSPSGLQDLDIPAAYGYNSSEQQEDESTDVKLATLASLHPSVDQDSLLDFLVEANGSVESVCHTFAVSEQLASPRKKSTAGIGHQTSLASFRSHNEALSGSEPKKLKKLTRKGQTLHLYAPEDIAAHTPCSIIHNFLPKDEAEVLLKELLEEAPTFERQTFKLFDNVVESPHSACFYVDSLEEQQRQKTEYLYNGRYLSVRQYGKRARCI